MMTNSMDDFGRYLNCSGRRDALDLSGKSLLSVLDAFCEFNKGRIIQLRSHYSSLILTIRKIESKFGTTIMPYQVNEEFWDYFILFSLERGLSYSSVNNTISQLRGVLHWSARYGAIISDTLDFVDVCKVKSNKLSLSESDISRLYYFNINSIPRRSQYKRRMERIKDMFVLSCCLGQRHSDMIRINASCFNHNIFTITQLKTGNKAYVDINKMAIDRDIVYQILHKYNYEPPYKEDISHYDRGLKDLFKYVGFLDTYMEESSGFGTIDTIEKPKWEFIGSHTARRSFITINILRNYPIYEVMRASGHTSYSSFRKYLCYNDSSLI